MSKVFESIVVNFEFQGEIGSIEHTPRFGDLQIVGCGPNNRMHFCATNPGENITREDLNNFIDALTLLRDKAFPEDEA